MMNAIRWIKQFAEKTRQSLLTEDAARTDTYEIFLLTYSPYHPILGPNRLYHDISPTRGRHGTDLTAVNGRVWSLLSSTSDIDCLSVAAAIT